MVAAAAAGTSGDAACALRLPGGRLAFILSDGMGKGMKAAAESKLVVDQLRKLLKRGVQPSRAIKIVNKKMISIKGVAGRLSAKEETFATVDLIIIDKIDGFARFYKLGAAGSFLLRGGRVKKIQRPALPVGIVQRISASQIKLKLYSGDTLIIVSDGITEADRQDLEAKWLEEYLSEISSAMDPSVLANEIANVARAKYKNGESDDITVFAVQIS